LAICAWIVESHRGHLEVQSKVGEGSTFTVILPVAPASALQGAEQGRSQRTADV
jgi:signal transduction histidine kinase